jgi:hypothetical protein
MGLRRTTESPITATEREITTLRDRRGKLRDRLTAIEAELATAIEAQRREMVGGDLDAAINTTAVVTATTTRDPIRDAIGGRGHFRRRDQARERARDGQVSGRGARIDRLRQSTRRRDRCARAHHRPAGQGDPDVVGRVPHLNVDLGRGVEQLLREIERELRSVVASARSHSSALLTGETMVTASPAQAAATSPPEGYGNDPPEHWAVHLLASDRGPPSKAGTKLISLGFFGLPNSCYRGFH